jgi:hypothetical protein
MLTFRFSLVHSFPSAIRVEVEILADTFWSFAERFDESAQPTDPKRNTQRERNDTNRNRPHVVLPGSNSVASLQLLALDAPNGGMLTRVNLRKRRKGLPTAFNSWLVGKPEVICGGAIRTKVEIRPS